MCFNNYNFVGAVQLAKVDFAYQMKLLCCVNSSIQVLMVVIHDFV